jgi:hypothetical protein
MRLVKDNSAGAHAIKVPCTHTYHHESDRERSYPRGSIMFTLAEGYSDMDGESFHSYYCDDCVKKFNLRHLIVEGST